MKRNLFIFQSILIPLLPLLMFSNGLILTDWQKMESGAGFDLNAVWAMSETDVFAVEEDGTNEKELYEEFATGDDEGWEIHSSVWRAQTFTPKVSHYIDTVGLKLARLGSAGTITVSIRPTNENNLPTRSDLCFGTIDGNTITEFSSGDWYYADLGEGTYLTAGIQYAIVVNAVFGSRTNYLIWRVDLDGGYADGAAALSNNSGSSFSGPSLRDHLFQEWGYTPSSYPEIDIAPNKVVKATTVDLSITGTNTNFSTNTHVTIEPSGYIPINPPNPVILSPTDISFELFIPSDTPIGTYTIITTTGSEDVSSTIEILEPMTTTTMISSQPCLAELIFGEHSQESKIFRYFRDNVLSKTPQGRELIKLYYQWSPVIVKAMEEDEDFKEEMKPMIDEMLQLNEIEMIY